MNRYRLLEWNVKVGRPWPQVQDELAARMGGRDIGVLIECYTVADDIARHLSKTYHVIVDDSDHPEARDVVILVHRRHDITVEKPIRFRDEWDGPKHGLLHHGRVFPGVTVNDDPFIRGIHRVAGPNMRSNQAARKAEARLLAADAEGRRRYMQVGDTNESLAASWARARRSGLKVASGHSVDRVLHTKDIQVARTAVLDQGHSDHKPVAFTVTTK